MGPIVFIVHLLIGEPQVLPPPRIVERPAIAPLPARRPTCTARFNHTPTRDDSIELLLPKFE